MTLRLAWLFIAGSAPFVLGSVPAYADAVGATADGITYFIGSIFFTAAWFAQLVQAQTPTTNMIGSILFMISALASYVLPSTAEFIDSTVAIAGMLLAAVCFLVGAILIFPAWRHAVRAAQPSRPQGPQHREVS